MTIINAKFAPGQIIYHRLFDYRGVIIGVDACFEGETEWYEQMAKSKPPKDQPWYHVLVDDATHQTYVAEQNLELEIENHSPIQHPLINELFCGFDNGVYKSRAITH